MFIEYRGKTPLVHPTAFVAPTAVLIGDVEVGAEASVWFGTVVRGDNGPIRIGARTSVQDNAVLHVTEGGSTLVGADVTIGHGAVLEDCTIGDGALVGMNAVVLNGASVGKGALVAAGSVVASGAAIPAHVLAVGMPAIVKRELAPGAAEKIEANASHYVELSRAYLHNGIGDPDMHEIAEAAFS